ncbi:hypothetical protein BP5796_12577 [Coleophoma crateriformis]|uniref:Uncharacterized protein n=1 Tax=Coleophoma crateriformis TaxID=565419 RepID=A0A3D8Q7G3_9HELO|nr:hypothetical protein BP5796_12577 [Coleophoma crateriformis]
MKSASSQGAAVGDRWWLISYMDATAREVVEDHTALKAYRRILKDVLDVITDLQGEILSSITKEWGQEEKQLEHFFGETTIKNLDFLQRLPQLSSMTSYDTAVVIFKPLDAAPGKVNSRTTSWQMWRVDQALQQCKEDQRQSSTEEGQSDTYEDRHTAENRLPSVIAVSQQGLSKLDIDLLTAVTTAIFPAILEAHKNLDMQKEELVPCKSYTKSLTRHEDTSSSSKPSLRP